MATIGGRLQKLLRLIALRKEAFGTCVFCVNFFFSSKHICQCFPAEFRCCANNLP